MRLTIDVETASACDLLVAGAYAYFENPTTELICVAWYDEVWGRDFWIPGIDDLRAKEVLRDYALDPDVIFEAHNAAFEQAWWEYVMVRQLGLPPLPPERWDCTMARALYRGLPGALEKAASALGLIEQKDMEGRSLTLSLSKPMTQAAWDESQPLLWTGTKADWKRRFSKGSYDRRPKTIARVARYCTQDVMTEVELGKTVGLLSDYERRVWVLDQKMNQRGLRVDLDYIHACKAVVAEAARPLLREFQEITGLEPTQVAKLTAWCQANGAPQVDSMAKDALKALGIRGLETDDDDDAEDGMHLRIASLPEHVRRALSIRAILGSASIAKLDRMVACACNDNRIRYAVQYHGAGTGRWAGRLFQPQNFPRGKIEGGHDPEALVQAIMGALYNPAAATEYIGYVYGYPIAAVASGLRHTLVAGGGCLFNVGDFAGIEARVVLALAGQHDKCALLASGKDVYLDMASAIYGEPVTDEHDPRRHAGKGGVLGCGFGCGPSNFNEKFLAGADLALAERTVEAYRGNWAPAVPKLWRGLETASLRAVQTKGRGEAYGIVYEWTPGWLACRIPDGQTMWYRQPEFCLRPMPWDATDIRPGWSYKAMKNNQWRTIYAYGGLLTENVVQKIARGLLCEAMFRLEANGFPLVLTVHDECVSEVPAARSDHKAYEQIMAEPTAYARSIGIPIAVKAWEGPRYKK